MAVTLTTKFYESGGDTWNDLSKIVFTSPNIDSPNTAGTRSHILPGQGTFQPVLFSHPCLFHPM